MWEGGHLGWTVLLPFAVGVVTAMFNVVGGGGSLLTIPLLVELGLTPQEANATNRMGVWSQSATGMVTFSRRGTMRWGFGLGLVPASLVGGGCGAYVAMVMDARAFQSTLAVIFAGLGVLLLVQPWLAPRLRAFGFAVDITQRAPLWMHAAFLFVGFYGGFIQAGVGIVMVLVLVMMGGVSFGESHAIKMVQVFAFASLSLAIFAIFGWVRWQAGAALTVGGMVGGVLGAQFATRVSASKLRWILVVAVFLAAARFAGWI